MVAERLIMYIKKVAYFGGFCFLNNLYIRKSTSLRFMGSLGDEFTNFKASFPATSMGFFDQSQSNVEKIVEGSFKLTLFCHLYLISVTPSPTLPPV